MFNCAVGIVWQIALSVMPVFLVIRSDDCLLDVAWP